jgi:hypothetical protein
MHATEIMTEAQPRVSRIVLPAALLAATPVCFTSKQVDSPEVGVPWLDRGVITWAIFWSFLDSYTIRGHRLCLLCNGPMDDG